MDTKNNNQNSTANNKNTPQTQPPLSLRQKIAMRLLGKEMILGATVPFFQDNRAIWGDWSTERAISEGFKVSTYVYACIYRIMKAASSVPWVTVDTNTEEPIKGHPLTQLMKRPNNFMSGQDLIERMTTHLYLGGNGILSKVRANDIPVELWPMDPDGIKPVASQRDFISRYEWNKGGYIKDYPTKDIVHVMFTDPGNVFWGMSPLQAGAKAVDTDVEAMNWNKVSLQNRAISDGVFSFKSPLTKDQWNLAREMIKEQHQGSENARAPWVLGSDATWTPMSLSPVEMDWLKSREMTREDICAVFQVPPPMIGIYDKATLTNIETARIVFWLDTIIPYLDDLQSAFNLSITPEFGDNIELRYDTNNVQALREVYAKQVVIAKDLFALGVPFDKINEKLKLGFKKVPGGNVGYLPSNLMPTEMVGSSEVPNLLPPKALPLLPKEIADMERYFKLEESFEKKNWL